jgi:dipeptidase E
MGLVPFQINPHYTDARIEGHGGESRDQRIAEFLALHPDVAVAGLREGSLLRVENTSIALEGRDMRVFRQDAPPQEIVAGTPLSVHLKPLTAG